MSHTREQLDQELDALEAGISTLVEMVQPERQLDTFATDADDIHKHVGPEDAEHVWGRLQCMLRNAGLIPGDSEPCDEATARPDAGYKSMIRARWPAGVPQRHSDSSQTTTTRAKDHQSA